jgi:threonine/homoserine/homoserine lactone efflux protein/AraC-like DNA-binding protein
MANDWLELRQHADTGIETIRAHFEGHAYDPHWHDSYLVGITLSGTQEFHCRRERHRSTPGDAFLLEPGEIHDGDAPVEGGFTYLTFYLDEAWLSSTLRGLYESVPCSYSLHFSRTMAREPQLAGAIARTFHALHSEEMRIVQQSTMDDLLGQLTRHSQWRKRLPSHLQSAAVAHRARDYLHAHMGENIGLSDLARETGTDRFTLTRCFKREFHLPPCLAYSTAAGQCPKYAGARRTTGDVAAALGFADQSHLGAGSSGHIGYRQPITGNFAQIFQTTSVNNAKVTGRRIRSPDCEYTLQLPAIYVVCLCGVDNARPDQYSDPYQQSTLWHQGHATCGGGACVAASLIVFISGAGAGEVLRGYPLLREGMSWAGALWLSWMSWQLFTAPAADLNEKSGEPFSGKAAAMLQLINPKTWMMALAVVSLFAPNGAHPVREVSFLSLSFLLISVLCLGAWTLLGKAVNRLFRSAASLIWFQRAMALCLLISAWAGFMH